MKLTRKMIDAITRSLVVNAEQWKISVNTYDSSIWSLNLGEIEIKRCAGLHLKIAGQKVRLGFFGWWRLERAIDARAAIIASNELDRVLGEIAGA